MLSSEKIDLLLDFLAEIEPKAPGFCIPLSGGSDGALVIWLSSQISPKKTHGLHIGREIRCANWFHQFCYLNYEELQTETVDPESLRWAMTQTFCLKHNLWPVGSRTRTEQTLGSFSRSSLIATILPIVGLWKTEVIELCEHVGIPKEITDSSRKADPPCGRTIEMANIGIERLDRFLKFKIGLDDEAQKDFSRDEMNYLEKLWHQNQYKQLLPKLGPLISA